MQCPQCGKENRTDVKFCAYCTAPLQSEKPRPPRWIFIFLAAIIVILLAVGGWFVTHPKEVPFVPEENTDITETLSPDLSETEPSTDQVKSTAAPPAKSDKTALLDFTVSNSNFGTVGQEEQENIAILKKAGASPMEGITEDFNGDGKKESLFAVFSSKKEQTKIDLWFVAQGAASKVNGAPFSSEYAPDQCLKLLRYQSGEKHLLFSYSGDSGVSQNRFYRMEKGKLTDLFQCTGAVAGPAARYPLLAVTQHSYRDIGGSCEQPTFLFWDSSKQRYREVQSTKVAAKQYESWNRDAVETIRKQIETTEKDLGKLKSVAVDQVWRRGSIIQVVYKASFSQWPYEGEPEELVYANFYLDGKTLHHYYYNAVLEESVYYTNYIPAYFGAGMQSSVEF